jgi:hypothetical protein
MSVALHGKQAQEATVLIDTTVQEKNITYPTYPTYPTDAKLAIKIINRLNKLSNRLCVESLRCNSLMSLLAIVLRRVKAFLALARFLTWRK